MSVKTQASDLMTPLRGLVLLCGSHIRESSRISTLSETLESWRTQNSKVAFWVSISFETPILASESTEILHRYSNIPKFRVFVQKRPFKQFEHYAFLVNQLQALRAKKGHSSAEARPIELWVAFVDDDDTLGSCRIECFEALISSHSVSRHRPFVQIKGDPSLPKFPINGQDMTKLSTTNEYFEFCIELRCIEFFIKNCPSRILKSVFADCFLVKYLQNPDSSIPRSWVSIESSGQVDIEYNYLYRSGYWKYENKNHVDNGDSLERQLLLYISRTHSDLSPSAFIQWLIDQSVLRLSTDDISMQIQSLTVRTRLLLDTSIIKDGLHMKTLKDFYDNQLSI
jgi:hypothetical protein